ncbi:MAG: iron ABC transporter permease [Dehalococcoidia bacterium]|nr:iron ABC transporter permease [Dehalococcoidia bacterium]
MQTSTSPVTEPSAVTTEFLARRWKRFTLVLTLFALGTVIFLVLNIALGSVNIPIGDTVRVLLGGSGQEETAATIIRQIRLPRALGAVLGGAVLAVSGLLLQVFFRNPIVGPFILGISSGASFMVALVLLGSYVLGVTVVGTLTLSLASFIGALLVMAVVIAVASRVRDVITLLVIGLMTGYVASALSSFLIAFAQSENVHRFVIWTMGSFAGFRWDEVRLLAVAGAVLLTGSYLLAKPLNAFLLGEDYARSMGVNIRAFRYGIIFLACALAAVVTAFAGPVAFIGLAVPHLARLSLGTSDNRILIPASILAGAMITSLCDLLARLLFAPVELPVSATTALFGAPMVILFLLKGKTTI